MKNYYEILGLNLDASESEIQKAYRKLSMKFHPDKNDGDKYFEEWTKKINEAYEILNNPTKKKEYDNILKRYLEEEKHNSSFNQNTSDNSSNSIYNEEITLSKIRMLLPAYFDALKEYEDNQYLYQRVLARTAPNLFTLPKIAICFLLLLVSFLGLFKKSILNVPKIKQDNKIEQKVNVEPSNRNILNEQEDVIVPEDSRYINKSFTVNINKLYFYYSPTSEKRKRAYLVKGESFKAIREYNGYVYTIFRNAKGVETIGWLNLNGLILTEELSNNNVEEYIVPVESHTNKNSEPEYIVVSPEFPGGMAEMYKFLGKNLVYPLEAQKMNITGKVFANFIVEIDGSIKDITILKGLGMGCDEESIRLIKSMPKWNPGKTNGIPTLMKYTLPINFQLE